MPVCPVATDAALIVPWRPGCEHRERAFEWVQARYADRHPGWPVIVGTHEEGEWCKALAVADAVARTAAEVLIVADADVWIDGLAEQVGAMGSHGWAVPHRLTHRLSAESTERLLGGEEWHGLPLSKDNHQDRKPYCGIETGGIVILTREAAEQVPLDPRFTGWGSEDIALSLALRTLVGPPWSGTADLVHLWHPPQPRLSRTVGSEANKALLQRYRKANRRPDAMRALLEEVSPCRTPST